MRAVVSVAVAAMMLAGCGDGRREAFTDSQGCTWILQTSQNRTWAGNGYPLMDSRGKPICGAEVK